MQSSKMRLFQSREELLNQRPFKVIKNHLQKRTLIQFSNRFSGLTGSHVTLDLNQGQFNTIILNSFITPVQDNEDSCCEE